MSKNVQFVGIDWQFDFCDPKGNLYVKGAEEDAKRVGKMLHRLRKVWNDIHITFDSHNLVHVAHPIYWKDNKGRHPDPFTILVPKEVGPNDWVVVAADSSGNPTDHVFTTVRAGLAKRGIDYCKQLQANGRYPLCIWPPHCLIGTVGWTLMPDIMDPLLEWESDFNKVEKITKGSNLHVEHYSALQADVVDPEDPSTQMNMSLVNTLMEADLIAFTGQALSHCVANSLRDLVATFRDDSIVGKIVLIKDGTSSVGGFESLGDAFIKEMTTERRKAGKTPMQVSTCADFLA